MTQMSAQQIAAFESANSGALQISPSEVGTLVVSVAVALCLTWCAWVSLGAYRSLSKSGTTVPDAGGQVVRAVFVMTAMIAVMALNW